jgi:hypothetical protein
MLDFGDRGGQRHRQIIAGSFAVQEVFAADVHRDFRSHEAALPRQHHMRGHDAVVQQLECVGDPPLDDFAGGRGDGELSSGDFEAHGNPWPTEAPWPAIVGR